MLIYSTNDKNYDKIDFTPDFYELRLDLCEDNYLIPDFFYTQKTIITIRDKDEGGLYSGELFQKLQFYKYLLENTNFYIDIEMRYFGELSKIIDVSFFPQIIISVHEYNQFTIAFPLNIDKYRSGDFQSPLWQSEIAATFNVKWKCYNTEILNFETTENIFMYKFVFKIDSLMELLNISNQLKNKNITFCLMSVGEVSLISRVLYKSFGSKAVYYGLKGHETSVNQINDEDIIRYNLFKINEDTKIGGIIGCEQIRHSKGLDFYNNYFKQNNINAVYLPFVVSEENIKDFIQFVSHIKQNIYGFSVTAPMKEILPAQLVFDENGKDGGEHRRYDNFPFSILHSPFFHPTPINLWIPSNNDFYLTDETAFKESFNILNITKNTNIILLGTGAMAKTVLNLLPENKICVYGRDKDKIKALSSKYINIVENLLNDNETCLINTTTVGMKNENVFDVFTELQSYRRGNPISVSFPSVAAISDCHIPFDKIIDLTYLQMTEFPTPPLIKKDCGYPIETGNRKGYPYDNFPFSILHSPFSYYYHGSPPTPLITHCLKNKIPFVCGHIFWKLQAKEQLSLFLKNI